MSWSIYTTGKPAAEVGAHEPGHTLGLGHQGTSTLGYFAGHGSGATGWAPTMGVGYSQQVSSWAKGKYQDANNQEDELNIIVSNNNNVDYRPDDTGATLATSRYLELYSGNTASAEGVIEQTGDTDAFQFTTTGGTVSLTASPVGDWSNLGISATLANSSDTVIASNNPQSSLSASISTTVAAGTYTFRVTGAGRNDPLTTGFSSYASLGYYSITGTVAGARLPTRFYLSERATNGTLVGTVPASNTNGNPLAYAITSGNTSSAFAINSAGSLTVANSSALNYETLALSTTLKVQFELFVNITNTVDAGQTELNRRVVVVVTNVNEVPTLTGFSATVVDPVNNLSFWTIQEYAGVPVGSPTLPSSGRWGTWWGRIDPAQPDVAITHPADGMTYPAGATVAITATATDTNITFTKMEFFANATKIGEATSAPFTFEWTGAANGSYGLTALGTEISTTQSMSSAVNITVGDARSPLGTWELTVSGASKGAAYLTFADDFTLDGYGMLAGTFGLYTVSGAWSFGAKHQITGSYTETLNGSDLLTGIMTVKATSGKSLKVSVGAGKASSRKLSGKPAKATADLSGTWNAVGSSAKAPFSETYTLTPSATYDHVFDLDGTGASYSLSGSVLINSRNQLYLSTTNGVIRSLTGKLNVKKGAVSLKGSGNASHSVKIQATRQ